MDAITRMFHRHRHYALPSDEAVTALLKSQADWQQVREVAQRSSTLYSRNGFIEALSRSQERKRKK